MRTIASPVMNVSLALVTDTHYWPTSPQRTQWVAASDAAAERDGLLIAHSEEIFDSLLSALQAFAIRGGNGTIHLGDEACGGGGFGQDATEFRNSLVKLRAAEALTLPADWPYVRVPGNHDLNPNRVGGGLSQWRSVTLPAIETVVSHAGKPSKPSPLYRALDLHPAWRALLLDSTDGLEFDHDGHGHIGAVQLRWLADELGRASNTGLHGILIMHQLLVDPTADDREASGGVEWPIRKGSSRSSGMGGMLQPLTELSWIGAGDMIDNRDEVLELLAEYPHVVRLSLHGHVHANTLVHHRGVAFATLASTSEYPMQWHELQLSECEALLLQRPLELPSLRRLSERRDTRAGRNRIKAGLMGGATMGGRVVVRACE